MKKNVLKYIVLFILIVLFQIFLPLDLDEIWNYGFAHNIATGLIPYKDFNMVITPFYPFFTSLFLLIKSNILVMYIMQAILILFTYSLLEKIYSDKANIFLILLFLFFNCIYPSYNSFMIFLFIILIFLEEYERNNYLIGIIIGLFILTKQSVGICILISNIICLLIRKDYKKILKRLIGIILPISIFIIFLLFSNSYKEFLNLCIHGLYDFGKNNRLSFNIVYILFFVFLIILLYLIKKEPKNIIYWYVIGFLSIIIPLFDINHFYYFLIVFITFIVIPKIKLELNYNLVTKVILLLLTIVIIVNSIDNKGFYYPNKVNHFEYKYITKIHEKELKQIVGLYDKYEDYNIVFLSRSSYLYKLVANKKINYLDLINRGNFGSNSTNKLYNMLKQQKNALFVVQITSFTKNDQTDIIALKFINKYCKKIDEFDDFKLYIRK